MLHSIETELHICVNELNLINMEHSSEQGPPPQIGSADAAEILAILTQAVTVARSKRLPAYFIDPIRAAMRPFGG